MNLETYADANGSKLVAPSHLVLSLLYHQLTLKPLEPL